MKTTLSNIALIAILSLGFINTAHATTGGPNFIYDFKYNHADESVYFTRSDQSGRGCPPELFKISLETRNSSIVYTCDMGEAIVNQSNNYNYDLVRQAIQNITNTFKPLTVIDLKKNNIEIDLQFVKEEKYQGDDSVRSRTFKGVVYQNNQKVDEFILSGCSIDQPFIFQGYAIPGFEKKIMILSSTRSDCVEGGYIGESIKVVGGVDNLDKSYAQYNYKSASALVASESTLIVFEADTVSTTTETETPEENNPGATETTSKRAIYTTIVSVILVLGAGFLIGQKMNRKI